MIEPGYVTLYPTIRNVEMSYTYMDIEYLIYYRIAMYRSKSYHIIWMCVSMSRPVE